MLAALVALALVVLPAPRPAAADGACTILGTPGDDVLEGTPGDDVICGLGGNDRLSGGAGADHLIGGSGADLLIGGAGADTLDGGPGRDTASFSAAPGVRASLRTGVATGAGVDTLLDIQVLVGSGRNDVLEGSAAADRIEGGRGADVIEGLGGNDVLSGGPGNDRMDGGPGFDTLDGGAGADRIDGGAGEDTIDAGPGWSRIDGGPGVDTCLPAGVHGPVLRCERRWRPVVFATAAGLSLYQPAAQLVRITYHESLFASAIALRPRGHMLINANPRKFRPPPPTRGPGYIVMGPRGRAAPATSASDDVMKPGTPVLAPVTGRVVSVTPYILYCEALDVRVVIRPDARPRFTVVMFHVDDVRVHAGQHVVSSATVIGVPKVFRGSTPQTDTYVAGKYPHVHIEVERNGSQPIPGCRLEP